MAKEIERKFLVKDISAIRLKNGLTIQQAYLNRNSKNNVRIRIMQNKAYLTIKEGNTHKQRLEYEYEIPVKEAKEIMEALCLKPIIKKFRYQVEFKGMNWDIDVFDDANKGLYLAEIELEDEQQNPALPPWVGTEVTGDPRYYNENLMSNPFNSWS